MKIIASPKFLKAKKKALRNLQLRLDDAVRSIADDPTIGESKKGDLAAVRVHKFKDGAQQYLVAYMVDEDGRLLLLAWGVHENFYRDLKR